MAGLASAVWPAAGGPDEAARGRPWTASEGQACWAAGLWVRAFNAKKERMDGGGPQLDRLAEEAPERSARAGLA